MLALCACSSQPDQKPRQGIAAGPRKVNPKDGLTYVWIPPGTFTMGCSPGDAECKYDEEPAHEVTLTKGFWMGQTPVTVGAWKRYAQATGKAMPPQLDISERHFLSAAGDDSLPVVEVGWEEAADYCRWVGMWFPTEAQWEYAARAGTTGARYGNLAQIAWYADNSGRQHIDSAAISFRNEGGGLDYRQSLLDNGNGCKPVGRKLPNGYGLYDMLGNVEQWTADRYREDYYRTSEKQDPSGPPDRRDRSDPWGGSVPGPSEDRYKDDSRVLRGGSFASPPGAVRVSSRRWDQVGSATTGLRCVGESISAPPQDPKFSPNRSGGKPDLGRVARRR